MSTSVILGDLIRQSTEEEVHEEAIARDRAKHRSDAPHRDCVLYFQYL